MEEKLYFKVRWLFALLAFLSLCFNYGTKVILPATMEAMVEPEGLLSVSSNSSQSLQFSPLYSWSLETQNDLKEAFFFGYMATGIIGGRLSERLSAKILIGISVLISSVLSILFPYLTTFGQLVAFSARVVQGLANGIIYPAINSIFPRYIPVNERSIWGSFIYSGSSFGTLLMLNLSGFLSEKEHLGGWKTVYYLLGGSGIIWSITWMFCISDWPHNHFFISQKELFEITDGIQKNRVRKSHPLPWLKILTSLPFYAIGLSAFVYNWAYLTMLTQLPKYLHRVIGFSIEQADEIASIPYVTQSLFGYIAGFALDFFRRKKNCSITSLRKIFNTIGFLGAALCLFLLCFAGHNKVLAVILLSCTMGMCGVSTVGYKITNVDMSPTFAGTLVGISNTIGNIPGILAPMMVSYLVSSEHSEAEWNKVFTVSAFVFVLGAIIFLVSASAEIQPWDPMALCEQLEKQKIPDVLSTAKKIRDSENRTIVNEIRA